MGGVDDRELQQVTQEGGAVHLLPHLLAQCHDHWRSILCCRQRLPQQPQRHGEPGYRVRSLFHGAPL